jgi:hypothetical protein
MWIVTGTTRRASQASIITTRPTPARSARNSVWPGKAKPAPSSSAFLWIGKVVRAEAAPDWTNATPRAMAEITDLAFSGRGVAGRAGPSKAWAKTGNPERAASGASSGVSISDMAVPWGRCAGSPIQKNGSVSPKACQHFTASSGPIPAGSPQLTAIGAIWAASSGTGAARAAVLVVSFRRSSMS